MNFNEGFAERKYTNEDLEFAKIELINAGNELNSFDLDSAEVDWDDVVKSKNRFDDKARKFREIFQAIRPNE